MAHTLTLRLPTSVYESVKRHADADGRSMNAWVEALLDAEDLRRRCRDHDRYLSERPEAVAFAEAWADQNLQELTGR